MNNCKTRFINKTYKITSTATKLKYLSSSNFSMIEFHKPTLYNNIIDWKIGYSKKNVNPRNNYEISGDIKCWRFSVWRAHGMEIDGISVFNLLSHSRGDAENKRKGRRNCRWKKELPEKRERKSWKQRYNQDFHLEQNNS